MSPGVTKSLHSADLAGRGLSPLSVTAVYAGSFDPFTLGHKDIAARAARIYAEVVIAIGVNPSKTGMFSPEERRRIIEDELRDVPGNFRVESFTGLLAHYATSNGAQVLVRGIRGITDTAFEIQAASINREQSGCDDLETVLMPSRKQFEDVSSSATKELIRNGGDVRNYISPRVELAMRTKLQDGDVIAFLEDYSESLLPIAIAEKIVFDRWMQLARRMRLSDPLARAVGTEILEAYKQPHRGYHNLVHIAEGLLAMESFQAEIAAFDAFQVAWFFHDFVYDPGSKIKGANEKESIKGLQRVADSLRFPSGITKRAAQFIQATIDHKTYEGDLDGAFFIDNDLWILGAPAERYLRYVNDLRREYEVYDDAEWAAGRLKFLETMSQREQIFKTELFQSKYGASVDTNIAAELAELRAKNG
jgi:pantetheine-phosphate adenylyltransferase